jgi:hypothetical protein
MQAPDPNAITNTIAYNLVFAAIHTGCSAPIPIYIPLDCVLTAWKQCVLFKTLLKINAWQIVAKCCHEGSVDIYVSVQINNTGIPIVEICAWHATRMNKTIIGITSMQVNDFIRDACSYNAKGASNTVHPLPIQQL